jgi:hypothetical protein
MPDAVIIEQMLFGWEAYPIVGELRGQPVALSRWS